MTIDEDALVAFTQRLVRTPSPSRQEAEVSRIYAEELESLGFDTVSVDSMGNVTGTSGATARTSVCFSTGIWTTPSLVRWNSPFPVRSSTVGRTERTAPCYGAAEQSI